MNDHRPGADENGAGATVVVADDHPFTRAGISLTLDTTEEFRCVAECGTLAELRLALDAHDPDLLVLDVDLAGANSIDALPGLTRTRRTRVVVLTMHDSAGLARQAIHAGAAGFVLKDNVADRLLDALRAARDDGTYVDPRLGAALLDVATPAAPALTERQRAVLQLVVGGCTTAEIARQLHLSLRTVDTERHRLSHVFHARGRAELVAAAARAGYRGP